MATIPRLTEEEVHFACAEIASQGERPTALTLLDRLGRGSLTTITKYLNTWHATDEAQAIKAEVLPAVVKLPQELTKEGEDLLKRMWHVAKTITDAELEIQREALQQAEIANQAKVEEAFKFSEAQTMKIERLEDTILELKTELAGEQNDHAQTVTQLNEAEKANVGLSKDNEQLQNEIRELKKQVASLEEANKAALEAQQQLQQSHVAELKQKDTEIHALDMQVHTQKSSLDALTKAHENLKADFARKDSELSKQVVELEKLGVHHQSVLAELKSVKAELKASNKAVSEAEKQVANLEGQLMVYKSLDNSESDKKTLSDK
jgi:DNA repair exonuclease SbcCD ATPase subunit